MNHIDEATLKILTEIAKRLPEHFLTDRHGNKMKIARKMYGSVLIEQGMKELKDGTKIRSNKSYLFDEGYKQANHLEELKKAYLQGGNPAVDAYYTSVYAKLKDQRNEKSKS